MLSSLTNPANIHGVSGSTRFTKLYNNAHFDYLSEMMPTNIKELFKWAEIVYTSTPAIVNGIRKLINYPITDLEYKTTSPKVKKATQEFLEEHLDIKTHLTELGVDYYVYGNAFRTLNFPFVRFLECSCGNSVNINYAKYKMKKGQFVLKCTACGRERIAKVDDRTVEDTKDIGIITWDPKQIDLLQNPITGNTTYYYKIPQTVSKGILQGNHTIVSTLPKVFMDAHRARKVVEMGPNFYHFKAPSLSGFASGWGMSPLLPTLKLYMYTAILRKASEAIGLEHITPKNILFPQGQSNDPTLLSSMGEWKSQIKKTMELWRKDPNAAMLAPYPTGVVNIGSQGRQLTPTAELKQAAEDMLIALDIPPEFVYGGTNLNNSPISLRILENQLQPYMGQVSGYLNWLIKTVNAKYDSGFCQVEFTPFKMADDMMKHQMLTQVAGSIVSKTTVREMLGLEPDEEDDRLKEEVIKEFKTNKELELEQHKVQTDIANRTLEESQAEQAGTIPQYNQQQLIANAQLKAQELLSMPYEQRRSALAQLSNEDYVMYALVSAQMETARNAQGSQQQGHPGAGQGGMTGHV